jgi:ferredoxin
MKRVVVDYGLCEANAVCMKIAPEMFLVDARDKLHLLVQRPAPELLEKVEKAVRRCPKGALSLVDE